MLPYMDVALSVPHQEAQAAGMLLPQVTISDGLTGETIRTVDIKADPLDMCVAERKEDGARREVGRSTQ
jgi:hypothetical protein